MRLRELELLQRERDLLQRELDLLKRSETPISHNSSSSAHVSFPNIKAISDLLNELSGSANSFETWEKKGDLVRDTYLLDNDASKILIISKLKSRSPSWFHRAWQYNEPFSDYFHDKVILANRVSITDEETVD